MLIRLLASVLILVGLVSGAAAQPVTGDLAISNLSVTPNPVQSGGTLSVTFRITNNGPGQGQLTRVEIFVDGVLVRNDTPLTIFPTPGSFANAQYSVTAPVVGAGTTTSTTVRVVITGGGDNNPSNNAAERFVTVQGPPRPDLRCHTPSGWSGPLVVSTTTGTTQTSPTITEDDSVFIDFAVINSGGAMPNPGGGVQVELFLNGQEILDTPFAPLQANGTILRFDGALGSLPAGDYTLTMVIDGGQFVTESNENNNTCSLSFTVESTAAQVDLAFFTPTGWPAPLITSPTPGTRDLVTTFMEGDTVYLDFAYGNFGSDPSGSFRVEVFIDDVFFGFLPDSLGGLAGTLVSDVVISGLSAGDHVIEVRLDVLDEVAELNENNNTASIQITVEPQPSCVGDIADDFGSPGADGIVSFGDFLALLGLVGPCGPSTGNPDCTGDIADDFGTIGGDGTVSFGDFLALLGLVGPCP